MPAEAYKSIYMNVQPTLMAAASVKYQGEDGEDHWIQAVIGADAAVFKGQFGRMVRAAGGEISAL